MQRVPDAIQNRFTPMHLLSTLTALAVLLYLNGGDTEGAVIAVAGIALAGLFGVVIDAYQIDRRLLKLLFGILVCVGGLVGIQEGIWPVAAFLVGAWILLDIVYDYRHGIERRGSTGTNTTLHEMQDLSGTAQPVLNELREYSKTKDELHAAVDEDDEEIDDALGLLQRMGTVTKHGRTYSLNEERTGPAGVLRKIGRRIARPFSISA